MQVLSATSLIPCDYAPSTRSNPRAHIHLGTVLVWRANIFIGLHPRFPSYLYLYYLLSVLHYTQLLPARLFWCVLKSKTL